MRVGILTYHFSDNYGALMQAYGLREWFIRRGIEANFINYHPRYVEEGGKFEAIWRSVNIRRNLKTAYLRMSHWRRQVFGSQTQAEGFASFRRHVLGVNGRRLLTIDDLAGQADIDLLVCGSDQIWNPSDQNGLDPVYFLNFDLRGRARRISYAPSFGRSTIDSEFRDDAGNMIRRLNAVSVREASGVNIVKSISGCDSVIVPDPSILIGDFSPLLVPPSSSGHVFSYALRSGEGIAEVARTIRSRLGVEVLSPYNAHRRWPEIGRTIYPTPHEWLSLLSAASVVVSNSFHGIAMSLIQKRPFIAIPLPGKKAGLNERVHNLLAQVGLTDRILNVDDATPRRIAELCESPINWPLAERKLSDMRDVGSSFLAQQVAIAAGG